MAGYGLPVLSFVVGLLLWEILVKLLSIPGYLFPPPSAIAQVFFTGKVDWVGQTLVTLGEALSGFLVGVAVGFVIALVITLSTTLNKVLMPYIVGLQVLPKVAIAPILYIILGFSGTSRVLLIVILTFFPIVINTSTGLLDVDRNLLY